MARLGEHSVISIIQQQRKALCPKCVDNTNSEFQSTVRATGLQFTPETSRKAGEAMEDHAWKSHLMSSLGRAWQEQLYTDITIITQDETIQAHKLILAVASPYFRALFSANLSESHSNHLKLDQTRGKSLKVVLEYIYSGKALLTQENAIEILSLAEYFQIHDLKRICCRYIKRILEPYFCLSVYELALMHQCQDLAQAAFQMAVKNCSQVISEPSFLGLQPQTLAALFKEQILHVTSEDELFTALRSWAAYDEVGRSDWYQTLLLLLKEDQMNPLTRRIFQEEIEERGMERARDQAFSSDPPCIRLKNQTSRHKKEEELLIVFGGESSGRIMGNAECIAVGFPSWRCSIPASVEEVRDLNLMEGQQVIPPMRHPRTYAAVAVKDNVIYLIGGQTNLCFLDSCETYHVTSNSWGSFPNLPFPLHGAEAAFLRGKLWVVGGRSDNGELNCPFSLLMYDDMADKWRYKAPMLEDRVHFAVAVVSDCLYVMGGTGTSDETGNFALDSCEKYDVETDMWMPIASLEHRRAYHRGAVIDDSIYAVGGYDGCQWLNSVERYDPLKDRWTSVSPMIGTRSSFGITVSYGRLYCIGGFSGESVLNTVEKYNPRTDTWHCVQSMRLRRYGLVAATLRLPAEKLTSEKYGARERAKPEEGPS